MEGARTLKANMKMDGRPCGWCQGALRIGDDAAVCTTCERDHHGQCWEQRAGCATAGCVNAPLRRLDAAQGQPQQGGSPFPQGGSPFPQGGSPFPQGGSPFPQGAPYGQAQQMPPGYMMCPNCRASIMQGAPICPMCRAITSPDGIYHGPKLNAPGATQALVYGILGLFICGVIFGPIAISKSNAAKRAMASDPTLGGEGMATAGMVLGVIDLIAWAILLVMRMSAR